MEELVLDNRLTISNVNSVGYQIQEASPAVIKSQVEIELDLSGLQLLWILNSKQKVKIDIKVKEANVELLSKIGFKSMFEGNLFVKRKLSPHYSPLNPTHRKE